MPDHLRKVGWAVAIGVGCGIGYVMLPPAEPAREGPSPLAADSRSGCSEAYLDRGAGQTRLGSCPARPDAVTLTAGLDRPE